MEQTTKSGLLLSVILLGLELLGHVDRTSTPPSESSISSFGGSSSTISTQSARPTWHTDDHRAMTLIFQSCEINIQMEIDHLDTAHEMWELLCHMFKQSSVAREYVVMQNLLYSSA